MGLLGAAWDLFFWIIGLICLGIAVGVGFFASNLIYKNQFYKSTESAGNVIFRFLHFWLAENLFRIAFFYDFSK